MWPINNVLHSLFSVCRLYINEQPVVKQPDYYPYKAYFANVLSYHDEIKNCQLSTSGFYKDLAGHFDEFTDNDGAAFRNQLFRQKYKESGPYKSEGTRFFGRLHLDLSSIDTGLPFGTKVRLELLKSSDAFMLMREKDDNENYKIKITACYLFLPIAQLSAPVYTELKSVLENKSASLHFRKVEVRPITVPKGKIEFNSDLLYPDDVPCRLICAFVEEKAREGDYLKNPFNFNRYWEVEVDAITQNLTREEVLERHLKELQDKFDQFQRRLLGETSQERRGTGTFFGRLRSSLAEEPPSYETSQRQTVQDDPDPPNPPGPNPVTAKRTVYIKKVELLLNGIPVGKLA